MRLKDILALGTMACAFSLPAFAAPTDYDGRWQVTLSCSASSTTGQPAFTDRFDATFANGSFSRSRNIRLAQGGEEQRSWRGQVQDNRMTFTVDVTRGSERWAIRLQGEAASPTRFDLTGGLFTAENRQTRSCQLAAALAQPAPQSLAATAPARAETERR
ncbi:MAG: hypothetical protein K2X11_18995, partial [Acetobacteraceae bacterium]|nr:hypothetical protein [Acetobacteraceae bacterium]